MIPKMSEIIERALHYWESDEKWTQGTDAKQGELACSPLDPHATSWCAQGVLIRSINDFVPSAYTSPRDRVESGWLELLHRVMAFMSDRVPDDWAKRQAKIHQSAYVVFDKAGVSNPCQCPGCKSGLGQAVSKEQWKNIIRYNDSPTTTFEDVRLVFKQALADLTE